jgi:hypothetical protein
VHLFRLSLGRTLTRLFPPTHPSGATRSSISPSVFTSYSPGLLEPPRSAQDPSYPEALPAGKLVGKSWYGKCNVSALRHILTGALASPALRDAANASTAFPGMRSKKRWHTNVLAQLNLRHGDIPGLLLLAPPPTIGPPPRGPAHGQPPPPPLAPT